MKFKNFLYYLVCLLPWFVSGIIFRIDTSYYNNLNLPIFAPHSIVFPIVWFVLYVLIAYSIYLVKSNMSTNYKIYLFINYLSNQLFTFCFFVLKNNFLALSDTIIVLISSLYLYLETKSLNKMSSKYLIFYILWNIFACLLIFFVFIYN